jgi:acyl carrier protein
MVSAGEACSWEIAERWASQLKFFNGYGPTECTVGSSWHQVETLREFIKVPIGSPINNVRIYLLDQHLNPVPIGVGGEVHIGGLGQARGYYNRFDLTAEKFIPDPFSREDGGRLYKTGDLARYLPNGNMEFIGRIDQQVKIRGFRIELGEIESILQEYKGIKDAVVILRDDTPGNQRLVAYLINEDGVSIEFVKLRVYLRERLPEFMIPTAFVTLEAFPLTPSGKIDRRALPIPDRDRSDLSSEYIAPRNEIEEKMANICKELLSLERVGVYDNFFDLGGHSLLATQFVSRLKETFRVDVALRTLFDKPMIAELANEIKILQERGSETQIPTIRRASREARRAKLSDLNRDDLKNKG